MFSENLLWEIKKKNAAHILKHKHIQGEYDFEKEE